MRDLNGDWQLAGCYNNESYFTLPSENVSDLYLCYSTLKRYIISSDLCGSDTENSNIIARTEIQTTNLTASQSGWYVLEHVTTMDWEERAPLISQCEDTSHQTQGNGYGMFEIEEATDAESTSDGGVSVSSIIIALGFLGGVAFACSVWMRLKYNLHVRSFTNRHMATHHDAKVPTSTQALSQIENVNHHHLTQKIEFEDDGQMETTTDDVILYIR